MSLFESYATDGFYDEMFEPSGLPRPHYRKLYQRLVSMSKEDFRRRCQLADLTLKILHAPTPANGNAGLVSGEGSGRHLFTQQQRRKKTGPACHTTGTESGTTAHEMNLLHI